MILFANNATSNLAAGIGPSATTISVTTGTGALYPSPTGGDYFLGTLQEGTNIEIVHVTSRTGDVMTVSRGQEGTTAQTFSTAALFENRVTKGNLNAYPQAVGTFSLIPQTNGGAITGTLINFAAADATHPGMVSTGPQTFGGDKTFGGTTTLNVGLITGALTVGGLATFNSGVVANTTLAVTGNATFGGSITSTPGTFISGVPDGASAVAFSFTSPSYVTVGAKLLSLINGVTEKASIDKDGTETLAGALILKNNTAVGASTSTTFALRANGGFAQISQGGGTDLLLRNVSWINPRDPAYAGGAKGDGTTDDTAAFQAALNATATGMSIIRSCIFVPAGAYKITATLTVPGSLGFMMIGEGPWASRLVFDPAIALSNGLVINSSQFVVLRNFGMWGKKSNPTGKMLVFDYSPVVAAATALTMDKLWLSSQDNDSAFQTGIYWSDAYGNNSEVTAFSVNVERFTTYGIHMPGSQQKAMNFFGCNVNGSWDGVDPSDVKGGIGGVVTVGGGGGSFQWIGGGVGGCRRAAFSIGNPNDPFIIDGVQSERCYRFAGPVADPPTSPSTGRVCVRITNCRCDCAVTTYDTNGYIQFSGAGSFIFQNNTIFSDVGVPKIRLSVGTQPRGSRFTNNQFLSFGSDAVSNFIFDNGAVDYSGSYIISENLYADAIGNLAYRNEVLDRQPENSIFFDQRKTSTDLLAVAYTQFVTNAASSTIILQTALPRDTLIKYLMAWVYNYFVHSGGADVFLKVGTTSGGDEILQSVQVNIAGIGDEHVMYGRPGSVEQGIYFDRGGYIFLRDETPRNVYVTITVSTGTVGNGTVTNLTRGAIHFPTIYEVAPRFIT